ncbi:MAG: type II secretion system protein GspG [Acidobacteriota bacterium]|jgi:hypothetical protein
MTRRTGALALALLLVTTGCGGEQGGEGEADAEGSYTRTLSRTFQGGYADRTRGDMQAIGAALAQRLPDAGGYPDAQDVDGLAAVLEPAYIRTMPRADAWGRRFRYTSGGSGFTLASDGQDGKSGTADDIVLTDGGFR